MREVQSSDAKVHLPQLLDDVERGETIIITRHGKAIARIVPERQQQWQDIDRAKAAIEALRKANGRLSLEDILSSRHEGHRF